MKKALKACYDVYYIVLLKRPGHDTKMKELSWKTGDVLGNAAS